MNNDTNTSQNQGLEDLNVQGVNPDQGIPTIPVEPLPTPIEVPVVPVEPSGPPSGSEPKKDRRYLKLILIFGFLLVVVIFLPYLTKFIENQMNNDDKVIVVDPLNPDHKYDVLACELKTDTGKINHSFYHYNGRLKLHKAVTTTSKVKINIEDYQLLCENFRATIAQAGVSGISIACDLTESSQIQTQVISYKEVSKDEFPNELGESNGFYPEFTLDMPITSVRSALIANGYTCKK